MEPLEERKQLLKNLIDNSICPDKAIHELFRHKINIVIKAAIQDFLIYLFDDDHDFEFDLEVWVRQYVDTILYDPSGKLLINKEMQRKKVNIFETEEQEVVRLCGAVLVFLDALIGGASYEECKLSVILSCLISVASLEVAEEDQNAFVVKLSAALLGSFAHQNEKGRTKDLG